MVRGSYTPPIGGTAVAVGGIQGSDSDGNTGLTIGEGVVGLRADGETQLRATTSGVSMRIPVRSVSASDSPVTVSLHDHLILIDASLGEVEINLPSAVTATNRCYIIKDKGHASDNQITVSALVGDIDGMSEVGLVNSYGAVTFASDGTNFWMF